MKHPPKHLLDLDGPPREPMTLADRLFVLVLFLFVIVPWIVLIWGLASGQFFR